MFWNRHPGPVLCGRVSVYSRRRWTTWVMWNSRLGGGPTLELRVDSIHLSAPKGILLESRDFSFQPAEAVMWRENFGVLGLPLGKRSAVRLSIGRGIHRLEVAVIPLDDFDAMWNALRSTGVRTTDNEGGSRTGQE